MTRRPAPLSVIALVLLGGLNAHLLAMLLQDREGLSQASRTIATWSPDLPPAMERVSPTKPLNAYGAILAQPVFFKSRQPYVPPAAPVAPTPKPVAAPVPVDPGFVLGGIAIEKDGKWAYVFKRADPNGAWLKEGDSIAGWQVGAITSTGTRLDRPGASIVLQLYPELSFGTEKRTR